MPLLAGQGVGLIRAIEPAEHIVRARIAEALEIIERRAVKERHRPDQRPTSA